MRLRTFGPVFLFAGLLLSACSGGAADADVLPIEDILASDIVVTPDPSGTYATLDVATDTDVACSVVYGTTDVFGLIATDDDMTDRAHTDHSPRLGGLAPNTTYQYRLQGSDAAGNLYQSDVMTFTTPQTEAAETPGVNSAPNGSVIAVSSEFSSGFAAENAIDGDLGTEWSTSGDGDDASITVDLGQVIEVVGIGFRSREMTDGSSIIEEYTVTVDDRDTFGPFTAGQGLVISEVDFEGRVLRFDAVTTTGANTGAVEIEVYAAS